MPALILLATGDERLVAIWEHQIPAGWPHAKLAADDWPGALPSGVAAILVVDAGARSRVSPALLRLPMVWVGEAAAAPANAKAVLTADATHQGLCSVLRLIDETVDQQAVIAMLAERCRKAESLVAPPPAPAANLEAAAVWELFEGAWELREDRDRLLGEFRRGARHLLQAGEIQFFLADGSIYRSDRGPVSVRSDDRLVQYLESRPYPIDADRWEPGADPIEEASIRSRFAQWGIRLLAPMFDGAALVGWIALGPRRDGRPYGESDRLKAALFARLLGRGLAGRPASAAASGGDRALLHEIGLTLAHELGNALVPLSTLRQWEGVLPEPVLAAARREIGELERLHREVGRLQELDGYPFETIDLRDVVADAARELGLAAHLGDQPAELKVAIPLIRFALRTLAGAAASRGALEVRTFDTAGRRRALISVRGEEMNLTGLAPKAERPGVPNQGRLAIFLAKEIVRLHGGEIRLGPGPLGSELVIELPSA
ncbi:MAG TPA: hypothetical protein VGL42_03485 [Opitutaceae bacterium]|jgi:hypothetical protein